MITVHGRTRCQFYAGIGRLGASSARSRKRCRSRSSPMATSSRLEDAEQALEQSGADGVMIGRGAYGRPWFVQPGDRAGCAAAGASPIRRSRRSATSCSSITRTMLVHYGSEVGARIARKHVGWYSKGLPGSAEFRAAVNQTDRPGAGQGADRGVLRAAVGAAGGMIKAPFRRRGGQPRPVADDPAGGRRGARRAGRPGASSSTAAARSAWSTPRPSSSSALGAAALHGSALADLVAAAQPAVRAGRRGLAQRRHDLRIRRAARRRRGFGTPLGDDPGARWPGKRRTCWC